MIKYDFFETACGLAQLHMNEYPNSCCGKTTRLRAVFLGGGNDGGKMV